MKLRKILCVTLSIVLLCMVIPVSMQAVAEGYTVTDIEGTTNTDKIIAPADNILVHAIGSATCKKWVEEGGTWVQKDTEVTPPATLYDGQLYGVHGAVDVWTVRDNQNDEIWVTYALDGIYDVDSFLLAGSVKSALGEGSGIYGFDIYVGDADAAAIKANKSGYSPVYSAPTEPYLIHGQRIELSTAVRGSKIVFCLGGFPLYTYNDGQIFLSELAATGTAVDLPYTLTYIEGTTNVDKVIASEDNILATATGSSTFNKYGTTTTVIPPATLYDGNLCGVDGVAENTGIWTVRDNTNDEIWVTYTLSGTYDIDSFLLAGSGKAPLGEGSGVYGFDVYIGDADADTIKGNKADFTPVYSAPAAPYLLYGCRVELDTAVRGTKIVFRLGGFPLWTYNDGQIFLSELAATGTEVDLPYKVTDIKGTTNVGKIIAPEDNILQSERGSCAYFGWSSADNKNMNLTVVPPAHLQDGKLGGVGESTTEVWKPRDQNHKKLWVTYVLNGIYDVKSFMVAGAGNTDLAEGCGIYDLKVYIGDVDAATIKANPNDYTPVYATDDDIIYGRRVDLKTPVRGTKVVLCMGDYPYGSWNDGQIWVTELAAAGTAIATDLVNLIAGKEPVDSYVTDREKPDRYNEERSGWLENKIPDPATVLHMTDGDYTTRHAFTCSSTTRLLDPDLRKYISVDTPWAVYVYHLGGTATVDQIVMTSTGEAGNYFLGGVDYYVGQTLKTLFDDENRVYTTQGEKTKSDENGELFYDPDYDIRNRVISATLETPHTGRYVALVVTRPHATDCLGYSQARIDEFEVFGTMDAANVEKFPQTTFSDPESGCTMTLNPYNYDDVELYERIGGLKVTKVACPDSMQYVAKDNWLMVVPADRYIYRLDLYDKQGNLLTAEDYGTRTIDVSLPNKTGGMQILGTVDDKDEITRVLNSRTDDGMLLGESVVGRRLVRLTVDDSQIKWNGVTGVNTDDTVAGVTQTATALSWWLWAMPIAVTLLVAVLWVTIRRRVR